MDKAAGIILNLLNETGIINVGGEAMSPFEFVKKDNPNLDKIFLNEIEDVKMGKDASMDISKMKKTIKWQ